MTAYVHSLTVGTPVVTVYNVAAVHDAGPDSVIVINAYGGDPKTFVNVSHVTLQPARERT
jgi:hypothetical protein